MKEVEVEIRGTILVPDEATDEQIEEAVEFAVGLNGQMESDNPVGMDLDWKEGSVEIRETE